MLSRQGRQYSENDFQQTQCHEVLKGHNSLLRPNSDDACKQKLCQPSNLRIRPIVIILYHRHHHHALELPFAENATLARLEHGIVCSTPSEQELGKETRTSFKTPSTRNHQSYEDVYSTWYRPSDMNFLNET